MKNLGSVTDPQDVATKQYVDSVAGSSSGDITVNDLFALLQAGSNISLEIVDGKVKVTATDTDTVTRVKGNAESTYRSGDVNLTIANLGVNASTTELNYVKGVTSDIQTQLNSKVPTSRTVNGKALSSNISLVASDVGAVKSGGVTGESGTHAIALSWSGSDIIAGVDNNAAVKTLIDKETIRTAVSISGLPTDAGYDCYYYPDLGICLLRLYYTGKAISAKTLTTLGTVPSGYRPSTIHSFAVYKVQSATNDMQAQINSSGQIRLFSEVAKKATDDMYITGFWFV